MTSVSLTDDINNSSVNISITTMNTLADICADTSPMGFPNVDPSILSWEHRKYLLIDEITRCSADFICLQEVDHWEDWFQPQLQQLGYEGYYAKGERHGLVLAWKKHWSLIREIMAVQLIDNASQRALYGVFEYKDKSVLIITTHLKAKKPFADIRLQQGQALLRIAEQHPMCLLVGDFNASPDEPVVQLINGQFESSFKDQPYTTAKVREHLTCHTIDYVWYKGMHLTKKINIPPVETLLPHYLPRVDYPSDHFSLSAEFLLK